MLSDLVSYCQVGEAPVIFREGNHGGSVNTNCRLSGDAAVGHEPKLHTRSSVLGPEGPLLTTLGLAHVTKAGAVYNESNSVGSS